MINPKLFYNKLIEHSSFISGVPDSLLKELNSCILEEHPLNEHIIAPNEGVSISLGIGNYISTGKISTIYFQNSGIGNTINPLISLADKDVYGIPMLLLIGWRGEPDTKDEPQHFKQGLIQESLLKSLDIPYIIIDKNSKGYFERIDDLVRMSYKEKRPVSILFRKNTFSKYEFNNKNKINSELESRELAIENIIDILDNNNTVFVGTTGKASRELYEIRINKKLTGNLDFLTVGGMGHASSIAAAISKNTNKRVICLDGDGALLMHMGSLVSNIECSSKRFIHVVLNNESHESVGAQPTLIKNIDLVNLANTCGYVKAIRIKSKNDLYDFAKNKNFKNGPYFLEYLVKNKSRENLGRPKESPKENINNLMNNV